MDEACVVAMMAMKAHFDEVNLSGSTSDRCLCPRRGVCSVQCAASSITFRLDGHGSFTVLQITSSLEPIHKLNVHTMYLFMMNIFLCVIYFLMY